IAMEHNSYPRDFGIDSAMRPPLFLFPYPDNWARYSVTVLGREKNSYAGGCPSDILNCRMHDGQERRLLCKYEDGEARGVIEHEANVDRHVVEQSEQSAPKYYGSYVDSDHRRCLILEYIEDATPLSEALNSEAMVLAAAWLGRFHASQDRRLEEKGLG